MSRLPNPQIYPVVVVRASQSGYPCAQLDRCNLEHIDQATSHEEDEKTENALDKYFRCPTGGKMAAPLSQDVVHALHKRQETHDSHHHEEGYKKHPVHSHDAAE